MKAKFLFCKLYDISELRASYISKIVLIAEDIADVRGMMEFLIQMHGFEALLAANGEEAVVLAEKHRPDLILMDLMMPAMDGFTAARAIKENNELSKIPIVAVTAFGDESRRHRPRDR